MNDSTKQTKEKIKIMQAFLDGKEVQLMKYDRPEWALVRCPEWDWVNFNYRLKPEKKIIDLSKMVGSDILCEFSNSGNQWSINKLTEIDEDQGYYYYKSLKENKVEKLLKENKNLSQVHMSSVK